MNGVIDFKIAILILFFCFIVFHKYFFKKKILINIVLDFLSGIVILFLSTSYLEDQIPNSNGHGSAIIYVFNFIFFAILYIISTVILYWKRSKIISILIPVGIHVLYMIYVFSFFEFAEIYQNSVLYPILLSFFPIYIYNYFKVFNNS